MGKGKSFRTPRRRGFDDDFPPSYEPRSGTRPERPFGGGFNRESAAPQGPVVEATVKWFNPEKGFGFAELADGTGDVFLHIATLQAAGHDSVPPGAKLRVNVGQGAKGRQVTAVIEVDTSSASSYVAPSRPAHGGGAGAGRPARPTVDPATAIEMAGTVKWFKSEKGFGFIASEDGGKDVFVHISVLERSGINQLAEGQQVSMRVVETPKGREAVSIALAG